MKSSVIISDPKILSGAPVFNGTRVPLHVLIEYLEAGQSIGDFLEGYPTVSREQIIAFLEETRERFRESA